MNEFKEIYEEMKQHGMPVPQERVQINIANATTILENCFKYFLSFEENSVFRWQNEYKEVASWLENNQGRGLFMYGDCGRGKSMLARYIIPAILLKYTKKVVSVYDVQQMNKRPDEVLSKHIIALDDIGTEEISVQYGNKRYVFAEIVDSAEKYGKLLIIASNMDGNTLESVYGTRVIERIVATTQRIEFKGKSLRK